MAITRDLTRVMSRLKAIYRSWAIPGAGQQVNAPRYRRTGQDRRRWRRAAPNSISSSTA